MDTAERNKLSTVLSGTCGAKAITLTEHLSAEVAGSTLVSRQTTSGPGPGSLPLRRRVIRRYDG
jgi:hypothetical protein